MAERSLGQLTIDILARTGAFEQGMDRAAQTARTKSREIEHQSLRSAQAVQQAWGMAAAAIQGALAGISVGAVFATFIRETVNAQNEQAQLAAVLRSTGHAAGFNAQQLNAMASAMEAATTFSAGQITEAQTTLLAFTGIVGQEFPRALQAAADMAARTGMTVKAAAETIGRALDVPSQGLTSLSRQGFRFSEEQKALAEELEATGRTAEAQAIVLRALEESYGGAAEAARDTLGGALAALRNTVASLLTGSDDGIRGLRDAVEGLNDALRSEGARDALDALAVTAQIAAGVFATRVVASVAASGAAFAAATIEAGRYQAALARMAGVSATTAAGLGAIAAAARVASTALSIVGGPLGAVVLAIGGAAYAWREYGQSARDAASQAARSVADIKSGVDELVESYRNLNELQRQQVVSIKQQDLAMAMRDARTAVDELGNAFTPALNKGTRAAASFRSEFTAEIKAIASDATQSSEQMAEALSGVIDKYIESGRASEAHRAKLVELAVRVVETAGNVQVLTRELDALADAQHAAAGAVDPVIDNLDRFRRNYEKFMKDFATPEEKFRAAVEEQKRLLGDLYGPEVEKRLRERYLPDSRKSRSAATELQRLVQQLQFQAATLGMTQAQAERYRIETAKGTEADRARAMALFDQIQAWKEADKAIKQAAESARYIEAINRELDVYWQRQNLDVLGIGMGDRQREVFEQELAIRQEYAERRRQLEEAQQVESTKLTEEQYQRRLAALDDAEKRQIEILRDAAQRKLEAESIWLNGVTAGLQNYVDEANNAAASVRDSVQSAFKGMEDSLANFVQTGKLNFSDLVNSIVADLARIAVKQSITGPLASAFANLFGGIASSPFGAIDTGGWFQYANGGVFGGASLSRYSNRVYNTPQVFEFAKGVGIFAEAGPEAIMPLSRGPDGKLGVRADLSGVGPSTAAPQVNIINQTSQPIQTADANVRHDGERWVVDVVLKDLKANGPIRRQLAAL